ncbi:1250_t:CDS:2, partial [Racocetra fulgida]
NEEVQIVIAKVLNKVLDKNKVSKVLDKIFTPNNTKKECYQE